MIPAIRLYSDDEGVSRVERGHLEMTGEEDGDLLSRATDAVAISFRETDTVGKEMWHTAPHRQFVITLSGELDFTTRDGDTFHLRPGVVLLAEDTTGSGHGWVLTGYEPWRRIYAILGEGDAGFVADPAPEAAA